MIPRQEIFDRFVAIVKPFSRSNDGLSMVITDQTVLLDDLMINSARMVDIVLETEECFGISVDDDSIYVLRTIGAVVDLISQKLSTPIGTPAAGSRS